MKPPTLKRNTDFRRLYYRGKSYVSPLLVTYVLRNRSGTTRIGITASRKIGKAVARNRSRRIIREACLALYPRISRGYDLVFVARGRTLSVKTQDVLYIMEKHLKAAGTLS